MNLSYGFKYRFINAFRELFVHHHGSLEFRAKIFALVIAADDYPPLNSYELIKELGMDIYNDDEDRANLLMLTTKEIVQKIIDDNGLDIDKLIFNIEKELKIVPRYAAKIDLKLLKPLIVLTQDQDTIYYQERILEYLSNLRAQYLSKH